jgi:hypothetical protein
MEKLDAHLILKEQIRIKETEQELNYLLLKDQFSETLETLKPINLIKEAIHSDETKNSLLDTALGMTSGFLAKKTIVRSSRNPLLKLLGTLVGIGVTKYVAKHPEGIKSMGGKLIGALFKRDGLSNDGASG